MQHSIPEKPKKKAKYLIGAIFDPALAIFKNSDFTKFLLLQNNITSEFNAISRNFCFNNNNNKINLFITFCNIKFHDIAQQLG